MHQAHRGKPSTTDIVVIVVVVVVVVIVVRVVGGGMEGYVEFGKAIEHVVAHGHGKQQDLLFDSHQLVRT